MMSMRIHQTLCCLLLIGSSAVMAAEVPDYEREQRLSDEYVDGIVVGDTVDLNDGERDFIGILTEAESEQAKGAILILHGRGFHPAWPTVIQPLRTSLPENGWATLSIQLPVLDKDAKYFDYVPLFPYAHSRIKPALKYLKEEGYERVVVLAHSCGGHMMMSYLNKYDDSEFDAYISVGSGATDYKQPMLEDFPFAKMKVPILDIYGSEDFPAVLRKAQERKNLIWQGGNRKSSQIVVSGADHYYTKPGNVEKLTEEISNWLENL